jgi:threonylcarbamoyladenosine tRNA methylthiotransferase MtaB
MASEKKEKFTIKVLGCKVNQHDATAIKEFLVNNNYIYTNDIDDANFIIIQTCTVTMKSDMEARKYIRHIQNNYPNTKIIVSGCYAERAYEELNKLRPHAIIGSLNPNKWQLLLQALDNTFSPDIVYPDTTFPFPLTTLDKTRAFLKIHDGCNNSCSYCIIPHVRGKSQSLPPEIVIQRLERLINTGYKEIIITGINLALYGSDISFPDPLLSISKQIDKINANFRVRFSSIEPSIKNKNFFEYAASSHKIAPHFHLPIQHCSPKILQDMNRPYTLDQCQKLIELIYSANPDACIGADIIVGYPTETNKDFLESYNMLCSLPLSYIHTFPFSPRPGTKAFNMKNCSPNREIYNRMHLLLQLSKSKFHNFKMKFINKNLQVLTLRYRQDNTLLCLSGNFIHAKMNHSNKNIPENTLINASLNYINDEFIAIPIN